jgi:cell fate regulator YaaT (PSP1 superfamily)
MTTKLDIERLRLLPSGYRAYGRQPLSVFDWYSDLPETLEENGLVEVQFKNTRKGYYRNSLNLPLTKGDMVAVESTPGHDIGEVTLTGRLVPKQMRKYNIAPDAASVKRIYRKATQADLDAYEKAKALEHPTMIKARLIAEDLQMNMKISDVEFQGDSSKATFYYIADKRIDFRELIKHFAGEFQVRIEMKQIGSRQEAGRTGGVGPCGRTLCCSTWLTGFSSVTTSAARTQDLSINMQKLAGQCAKLKCCMNYEVDAYLEELKSFPPKEARLETLDATFFHFKTDVFKRQLTYSSSPRMAANLGTISPEQAKEIIEMNKRGEKPVALRDETKSESTQPEVPEFSDLAEQDSLTRFDRQKKLSKRSKRRSKAQETPAKETAQAGEGTKPAKEPRPPKAPKSAREPRPAGEPRPKPAKPVKANAAPANGAEAKPSAVQNSPTDAEQKRKNNNSNRNRNRKPHPTPNSEKKND